MDEETEEEAALSAESKILDDNASIDIFDTHGRKLADEDVEVDIFWHCQFLNPCWYPRLLNSRTM